MRLPHGVIGLVYLVSGLVFAFNSANHSGSTETHWGYALTGITCLVIAAKFLGLPLKHEAPTGKMGKPDPFE